MVARAEVDVMKFSKDIVIAFPNRTKATSQVGQKKPKSLYRKVREACTEYFPQLPSRFVLRTIDSIGEANDHTRVFY
jgi:hypothetical protein